MSDAAEKLDEPVDEVSGEDILGMSDEDLENMAPPSDLSIVPSEVDEAEDIEDPEVSSSMTEDETNETTEAQETASEEETESAEDPENPGESDEEPEEIREAAEETEQIVALDYQAEYEKLLAPFRANGRDMQVDSVDDAIRLMQMGANYNKKMAGLKPNLKLLKMLENNELLDESKLNFLIDLDKKNPEAITQLLKDSGIDPLEVDVKADSAYNPTTYNVNDKEVELDNVLRDIEGTDAYHTTLDVITNRWDGDSKQVLVENPAVIQVINDQISSGIYDEITAVIEKERMLGRLDNISDLDAYQRVGAYMQENRLFKSQANAPVTKQVATAPASNPPQAKANEPERRDRKKAASSTRAAKAPPKRQEFNPLSMSDTDFEKEFDPTLLQ